MSLPRICLVHCGTYPALTTLQDLAVLAYGVDGVYLPDADPEKIVDYDVVVVSDRLPPVQRMKLETMTDRIVQDSSKTLIVLGQNDVQDWLPGLGFTFRRPVFWKWRTGEDTGTRGRLPEDPFWDYFDLGALNWHNHGLLHPSAGTKSLVVVEEDGREQGAVVLVDEVNQPARLLVTTMDPVYHHGSGFMPGATRMLYGLLRWSVAPRDRRSVDRSDAGLTEPADTVHAG
ncbi:hypothetical protein [Gordonia hydrophobica]|uniref:Uncharacterized protein n=1 Tax=Gordonia hydrophobica TaxID=40516 RepID=A0ABZ2U2Y1_9ACTN|nr:hypothetical protein [Gordonia hydrophobica]MBM7367317.1 hypothetical protein [Gordonia hydrophobica]